MRAVACEFFVLGTGINARPRGGANSGLLRAPDDQVNILIKSHGRTAKAFADAGEASMAEKYFATAMDYWENHGDPVSLSRTIPDVGYQLMTWRSKLVCVF